MEKWFQNWFFLFFRIGYCLNETKVLLFFLFYTESCFENLPERKELWMVESWFIFQAKSWQCSDTSSFMSLKLINYFAYNLLFSNLHLYAKSFVVEFSSHTKLSEKEVGTYGQVLAFTSEKLVLIVLYNMMKNIFLIYFPQQLKKITNEKFWLWCSFSF